LTTSFDLRFDPAGGLVLDVSASHVSLRNIPVRVSLQGNNTFNVWGRVDSGEEPPVWAEDLDLTFFGPGSKVKLEQLGTGMRAIGFHDRAAVVVEVMPAGEELAVVFSVMNPQPAGGKGLPLCVAELRLEGLSVGDDSGYACAHAYGGGTHGWGRLAELEKPGVIFAHGCIGQSLPLVCLHSPKSNTGLMLEFMQDGRPLAWLRPNASRRASADWAVTFTTHRLLMPGQSHVYSPPMMLSTFRGRPWQAIAAWRDAAAERRGLVACRVPEWVRRANVIEFNMSEKNTEKGFSRLDDPKCYEMLKRWRAMGYNAIFCVAQFKSIHGWLSPLNYDAKEEVGGPAAEQQCLKWMHELGFRPFLWVTTVGIDRDAPEVAKHPDWFTRRRNGDFFYAWESNAENGYLGYAPDGDPTSAGWREWLKDQVKRVIERGYDGVFVDGCIPRADNHAKFYWPGEGRNAVEEQVVDIARFARTVKPDVMTFVEDESPAEQAACELTQGRYHTCAPFFKKAYWDHGMGGGPEAAVSPPSRIPPELARDYLLLRYASLLPGVVSSDVIEGYFSEESRPWVVQSMLAGVSFKTHSRYVDEPQTWRPFGNCPEPPPEEKEPSHRLRGHEEFLKLLRLVHDDPIVRDAPRTIAGVEVHGDAAVVGILRPTKDRCLLTVIQFARRQASVEITLTDPQDMPAIDRPNAGDAHQRTWKVKEILHSMVDQPHAGTTTIAPNAPLRTTIAPCGFRIFELT
jgi:hypothetical protein